MEDHGDIIKQMILNQLNPSIIALGDEINLTDILGENWAEDPVINEDASTITNKKSKARKESEIKCSICDKVFQDRRYLNRHFSKHTNRYSCRTCGKAFARKETQLKHIPKCQKNKSDLPPVLNNNKKSRASEKNKYVCESCSKTFTRRENYDQHLMIHMGTQIICTTCQKSLGSFKSYRRHQKIHEETRVQLPCLYCPSKFSLKSNLQRHNKLFQHQTGTVCGKCNQCIKTKRVLDKHQNQPAISCTLCSEVFCLEIDLKNHLKANHPNLWFKCKECPTSTQFMTRREQSIKEHTKKIHSRELRTNECYTEGWYMLLNE